MARYIDAEALTERLRLQFCKDCKNYNELRCRACDIDDTIDFIEDTPTADVEEVVRGEWRVEFHNGKKFITCSACGSTIDCYATYIDENEYDGCPYCRAKMDGGKI